MAVVGSLHEFMAQHRADVLRACHYKINALSPEHAPADLVDAFGAMYDQITAALRRDFEPPSSSRPDSPLPDRKSDAALEFGADRLNRGYSIGKALRHVTTISDAVGEVADREDLAFTAREYQRFNICIDAVASAAVQQYWDVERAGASPDGSKRMGFLAHELRNAVGVARLAFDTIRGGDIGLHGRTAAMLDRSLLRLESLASQTLLAVHLQTDAARGHEARRKEATLRAMRRRAPTARHPCDRRGDTRCHLARRTRPRRRLESHTHKLQSETTHRRMA